MKCDIILAGVGGQGVLSISAIIAAAALKAGLHAKQSEVHGMAQRGGAVLAHLRISDREIASDLIPTGAADMVVSLEPLESLRHLDYLSTEGTLLTASTPVKNIPDYPDLEEILGRIRTLPHALVLDATDLARKAGNARATNMVMVGAASRGLAIDPGSIEATIREAFQRKGETVVDANLKAFRYGRETAAAADPATAERIH